MILQAMKDVRVLALQIFVSLVAFLAESGFSTGIAAESSGRPVRVLFLGHDSTHHNSNLYYPMLAEALGRDAIYFDYVTDVGKALREPNFALVSDYGLDSSISGVGA